MFATLNHYANHNRKSLPIDLIGTSSTFLVENESNKIMDHLLGDANIDSISLF